MTARRSAVLTDPSVSKPPDDIEIPELTVDPSYVEYVRQRNRRTAQTGQPPADYWAYRKTAPQFGGEEKELGPAQGEAGYADIHGEEEKDLPLTGKGDRAVYGVHNELPLQGPVHWKQFYTNWSDVGPQLDVPIADGQPLSDVERHFCSFYGIVFEKELGSGAFGTVWRCRANIKPRPDQPGQNQVVACKVTNILQYRNVNTKLHQAVRKLVREAQIMATVRHRNVVRILSVFSIHDPATGFPHLRYLLFMELCQGDLHSLIQQKGGKFSEAEARSVMRDLCRGLRYLHDNNVVHMDIKTQNILYTTDANGRKVFKWADFGLANMFPAGEQPIAVKFQGTILYRAPEVFMPFVETDARKADIYSLGVVMMQLVCGWCGVILLFFRVRKLSTATDHPFWLFRRSLSESCIEMIRSMTQLDWRSRPSMSGITSHHWLWKKNVVYV